MTRKVTFDDVVRAVKSGKIRKPYRGLSKRKFKKHCRYLLDCDGAFVLATNAKPGDVFCEHGENKRILRINGGGWHPIQSFRMTRRLRRGKWHDPGYIVTTDGKCVCGCDNLRMPMSPSDAGKLALDDAVTCTRVVVPSGDSTAAIDVESKFAEFTSFWANIVALVGENGVHELVDCDGVQHARIASESNRLWNKCWESAFSISRENCSSGVSSSVAELR